MQNLCSQKLSLSLRSLPLWAVLLLCLLPPGVVSLVGCGPGGNRSYSSDLTDNYLFAVTPAVWRKAVITYRIEGGDSEVPFVDMPRRAEAGLRRWNVGDLVPAVKAQDGETPDVVVTFGTRSETQGKNGLTSLDIDNTTNPPTIRGARILLLRSLTPGAIERAAAHEGGHSRGLRGHSDQPSDLMAPDIPGSFRPTQRDYATALLIQRM